MAGGAAGLVSSIVIAALKHFAGHELEPELAALITTVVTAIVSYMIPPAAADQVVDAK